MSLFSFFKKLLTPVLVLSFFMSIFVFIPTQASTRELRTNKRNKEETSKILRNLKEKDPQKVISQNLEKNSKDNNELNSSQGDNLQVKFNLRDKKINLKNKDKGNISIGIPNSDKFDSVDVVDNKVIYSGQNSKTDVIVESVDGGFRQVINIKDSTTPSFYDFPVDLGINETLSINDDGSAVVKKVDGSTKLGILKPWAVDKNKKDLNTWYTIENGNILRQNIELKDASFPVLADPTWCGNQINKAEWVDRTAEGGLTLSLEPTWCGRNFDSESGYKEAISKASSNSQFPSSDRNSSNQTYKYKVMRQQYLCHFQFATAKSRWNIEPWRPLVEWRQLINPWDSRNNSMCNAKS